VPTLADLGLGDLGLGDQGMADLGMADLGLISANLVAGAPTRRLTTSGCPNDRIENTE
jgi:hypothetical protein